MKLLEPKKTLLKDLGAVSSNDGHSLFKMGLDWDRAWTRDPKGLGWVVDQEQVKAEMEKEYLGKRALIKAREASPVVRATECAGPSEYRGQGTSTFRAQLLRDMLRLVRVTRQCPGVSLLPRHSPHLPWAIKSCLFYFLNISRNSPSFLSTCSCFESSLHHLFPRTIAMAS